MNLRSEMREFQDLHTQQNCARDFTGSLHKISSMISNGRIGCNESPKGFKEEDIEGGGVRISNLFISVK